MEKRNAEKLIQYLDDAVERGLQLLDEEEVLEHIDYLKDRAKDYIGKNPIKSIGAGLLTGFLLGKIFSSEDD